MYGIREGGSIRCGHRFLLLEHNKEAEKCYRLLPPTAWKASDRALDSKAHFLRHRRARRFATSAANPGKCRSAIAYVTTSRLSDYAQLLYWLRIEGTLTHAYLCSLGACSRATTWMRSKEWRPAARDW